MGFVVKNTTKWGLLDLICPHSCRGCNALGAILCERCKNHIIQNREIICPHCKQTFSNMNQQTLKCCKNCDSPFTGLWSVDWRAGALAKLVSEFKYQSVRACSETLVELLDYAIPDNLSKEIIIIPLPTIGKHIRERGLDHTRILAKKLARRRSWQMRPLLQRATDSVQVGTNATERQAQATRTYELAKAIDPNTIYLLLDDVWTTGASMVAAANILKQAGVKTIYGAIIEVSPDNNTEQKLDTK